MSNANCRQRQPKELPKDLPETKGYGADICICRPLLPPFGNFWVLGVQCSVLWSFWLVSQSLWQRFAAVMHMEVGRKSLPLSAGCNADSDSSAFAYLMNTRRRTPF